MKLLASLCAFSSVHSAAVGSNGLNHNAYDHLVRRKTSDSLIDDPGVYPGGSKDVYKDGWPYLPNMDGATIDNKTFTVGDQGAVMTTYITKNYDPKKIKRVVIQIHGEYRDAWNQWMYSNMSATNASKFGDVKMNEVLIVAPMFFSVLDVGAYPHDANNVSNSKRLIWDQNGWGDTDDAVYPSFNNKGDVENPPYEVQRKNSGKSKSQGASSSSSTKEKRKLIGVTNKEAQANGPHVGSMEVLDTYVSYFTDKKRFPNVNRVVIAGFSMGGQTVNRYVTFRADTKHDDMVTYWISSPASFLFLDDKRPKPTKDCPGFNKYKYGLDGNLPGYVKRRDKENTPDIIRERYLSRTTYYFVGTEDSNTGDKSCEAKTQGNDHVDRMDYWVRKVLPSLPNNPNPGKIPPTIGYAQVLGVPHLASGIILSSAGMQSLYLDDYNGPGKNAKGPRPIKRGGQAKVKPDQGMDTTVSGKPKSSAAGLAAPGFSLISALAFLVASGSTW